MQPRHTRILELLTANGKMEVHTLSDALGVSEVTIRKDLNGLAEKGLVRREHGAAMIAAQDDMTSQIAHHYARKQRIAALAARSVMDGETVLIESGACCTLLASTLATTKQDITIVTNSAFIAAYLRGGPPIRVMLLGGEYQPNLQVMVGPMLQICVEAFHVDKLFIGIDGFQLPGVFMGNDFMRAEAVRHMARQATHTIVLTESERFKKQGTVSLMYMDRVSDVYTDERLDLETGELLMQHSIAVHQAFQAEV